MGECLHKIQIHELGPNRRRSGPNHQNHQPRTLGLGLRRFPHPKGVVGPILDPQAQVRVDLER